jgi:hypothetical protein
VSLAFSAWSSSFSSGLRWSVAARSRTVRAGVVTGIPSCVVVSSVRAVDPQALALAPAAGARHRDVDDHRRAGAQAPQRAGGRVAEHGFGPGGEHGRHPAATARQDRVPHRVHAAMQSVEPTHTDPIRDCVVVDAEHVQLPARDDAVLAGRERRDLTIRRGWAAFL